MKTSRWCAGVLLAAAFAMVMETSCSQAPPPTTGSPEPKPGTLTKIYTVDHTLYIASRYAVADSFVVIQELVRDRKYYPYESGPHLYNRPPDYKMTPANCDLPIMIPLKQVYAIGPWRESHETRNGVVAGIVILGGLIAALWIAAEHAFNHSAFN